MRNLLSIDNVFFLNGVVAVLGWNSVLSSLDYFNWVFHSWNVFLLFPIPCFVGATIISLTFQKITARITLRNLVVISLVGTILALVFLLACGLKMNNGQNFNQGLRFSMSIFILFWIGVFCTVGQLAFFSMINNFGAKVISRFTFGMGVSGLVIIGLRAIIVGIFGDRAENKLPIILYIAVTIILGLFILLLNLQKVFTSEIYLNRIQGKGNEGAEFLMVNNAKQSVSEVGRNDYGMLEVFKSIFPYPLLILLNYILTMMLFPNIAVANKHGMSATWSVILYLTAYGLGDSIGKALGELKQVYNARSILYLFCCRFFFLYSMPLMAQKVVSDDYLLNNFPFSMINMILFSFTSGLFTVGAYMLSNEKSPSNLKKASGALNGVCLQLGITIGSFLAIPFQSLINPDIDSAF